MKKLFLSAIALFAAFTMNAQERGLKDAYKDYFDIGVAINTRNLDEASQKIILQNFNSITAENEMKPGDSIHQKVSTIGNVQIKLQISAVSIISNFVDIISVGTLSSATGCSQIRKARKFRRKYFINAFVSTSTLL